MKFAGLISKEAVSPVARPTSVYFHVAESPPGDNKDASTHVILTRCYIILKAYHNDRHPSCDALVESLYRSGRVHVRRGGVRLWDG